MHYIGLWRKLLLAFENTRDRRKKDEPKHCFYAEIVLDITTRNTERNSIYGSLLKNTHFSVIAQLKDKYQPN
jgi:hypothetical protein